MSKITETYLKSDGDICPLCKSVNFIGNEYINWISGITGFRDVHCNECKVKFVEELCVVGIEIAEQQEV